MHSKADVALESIELFVGGLHFDVHRYKLRDFFESLEGVKGKSLWVVYGCIRVFL